MKGYPRKDCYGAEEKQTRAMSVQERSIGGLIYNEKLVSGSEVVKNLAAENPSHMNLRGGGVADRWALNVACPFPISDVGERYITAAVEYVTRYAAAAAVKQHTAPHVAEFLMREVVLKFGPFREILTNGAPELTGKVIDELITLLESKQINPVPYRPQTIGLVERLHRT
ncbi:Uncharacterized protein PHPALM_36589 [Phytophthora palmivora]|uniref:Integrase catalytic domain-containing protein n=1 Tax=Phytophthora palmivora TaxID=4796 RepID=A0A2P4WZK8_9STRA|nr:Uncharacterized protein PHPALM_36589 [Phytophthora palmivora]